MLFQQHWQRGEASAVACVHKEQHDEDHPHGRVVDRMERHLHGAHGNRHDENHHITGFAPAAMIREGREPQTSGCIEHCVHRQHHTDETCRGSCERRGIKPCESRHCGECIMEDVFLLRNQRQTARDVEVERHPDGPEDRAPHHRAPAYARRRGIYVAGRAANEQKSQEHHDRIHGSQHIKHADEANGRNEPGHDGACDGLRQSEACDGDARGETLVVGEPQHEVLHWREITHAQADSHDRAVADEHAGQPSGCDARARSGESCDEAYKADERGSADVLLHHGAEERGGHAEEENRQGERPLDGAGRRVHLVGDDLLEHTPAVHGADGDVNEQRGDDGTHPAVVERVAHRLRGLMGCLLSLLGRLLKDRGLCLSWGGW